MFEKQHIYLRKFLGDCGYGHSLDMTTRPALDILPSYSQTNCLEKDISISSYLNMQEQQESGLRSAALVAGLALSVYLSSNARATAETIQANEGLKMYTV